MLARIVSLTAGLAFVRISALIILLFLGLVGYQASTQHASFSDGAISETHLSHTADHDVDHGQSQGGGHAEHDSNCWAHATCSPATVASMNSPNRVDMMHDVAAIDVLDYRSRTFPPSSPPPRA
jgi:hypothetical protein